MQRAELIMPAREATLLSSVSRTVSPARVVARRATTAETLLDLQRTRGNAFVRRSIQCRLSLSQPGDPYEQEADRVADAAVKMPDAPAPSATVDRQEEPGSTVQRLCSHCQDEVGRQAVPIKEDEKKEIAPVRRQEMPKDEEEMPVAMAAAAPGVASEVGSDVEAGIQSLSGGGRPLSTPVRADMESRMGFDFGAVRVHTDGQANHLTRSVNALAFTHGSDVVFGSGQYQPETPGGKHLLAHELTHVVQQTGGIPRRADKDGEHGSSR